MTTLTILQYEVVHVWYHINIILCKQLSLHCNLRHKHFEAWFCVFVAFAISVIVCFGGDGFSLCSDLNIHLHVFVLRYTTHIHISYHMFKLLVFLMTFLGLDFLAFPDLADSGFCFWLLGICDEGSLLEKKNVIRCI